MDQLLIECDSFPKLLDDKGLLGIIQLTFVYKSTAELGAGFLMWLSHVTFSWIGQPK